MDSQNSTSTLGRFEFTQAQQAWEYGKLFEKNRILEMSV